MKHLKTFGQHHDNDINESMWGDVKKFTTGYGNKEEKEGKKSEIITQLDNIEASVKENPEAWQFNRDYLMKAAEGNNFRGELRTKKGGANPNKTYVIWNDKATGLQDIAGAASNSAHDH
jgi:hypothetical protein